MSSLNTDGSPGYINAVFANVRLRPQRPALGTTARGRGRPYHPGLRCPSPGASSQRLCPRGWGPAARRWPPRSAEALPAPTSRQAAAEPLGAKPGCDELGGSEGWGTLRVPGVFPWVCRDPAGGRQRAVPAVGGDLGGGLCDLFPQRPGVFRRRTPARTD